jgi:ABC-type nitrate/sulfonate/bicarbonate transport system, permease component
MLNWSIIRGKCIDMLFYLVLLMLWQLAYYLGVDVWKAWKGYSFPNPYAVLSSLLHLAEDGRLFVAVFYSLRRASLGFILALTLGLLVGISIAVNSYLKRNLKPILMGLQSLPSICWVPFSILWFGLGESSIIFVVFIGTIASIAMAIEDAICGIPIIYIKAAKTMGASKYDILLRVQLPAALPSFALGLKQSWSFAWRALMSGEVLSSCIGLGYTLMLGRDFADINQIMAVMVVIVLVGILIDRLVFSNIIKNLKGAYQNIL